MVESVSVSVSLCTVSMVESVSALNQYLHHVLESILSVLKSVLSVSSSSHTAASFYEYITIHQ